MSNADVPGHAARPVGDSGVDDSARAADALAHPPRLFTYEEWRALSDDERDRWAETRRLAVESAREQHNARQRLNDALTVERFAR